MFLQVCLWFGGMLAFNIATNVIVLTFIVNRPEEIVPNIQMFLWCLAAIAIPAGAAFLVGIPLVWVINAITKHVSTPKRKETTP
jgi:hypothetical protein